jgi:hypothetical protein
MNHLKRAAFLTILASGIAQAHHGQDFLLNYDPGIPGVNRVVGMTAFEWTKQSDGVNEISAEPGFLWGITPTIAIGTTVRIADEGTGSWGYSGVNPMIQFMLPRNGRRWSVGVFAGYLFADSANQPEHSHGEEHIHDPNPGGIDLGPDAPPPEPLVHLHEGGASHSHTGIHRHGEDHFQLRLLFETPLWEDSKFVCNLIGVTPGGGDYAFGYSVGVRQEITHEWSVGLEAIGDFNTNGEHEALAGVYWTPIHECTVRFGAGKGIGSASKDFSLHTGFTWRF